MTAHPIERLPANRWAAISDNEFAVSALLSSTNLPGPTIVSRLDAVYVSVADVDDLGQWLTELGGEIHVSPTWEGVQLWTLHTATPERADGSRVAVRVSTALPADAEVLHDVLAAVVR